MEKPFRLWVDEHGALRLQMRLEGVGECGGSAAGYQGKDDHGKYLALLNLLGAMESWVEGRLAGEW